ncbi:MAG: transporter substrate-binding domain-containing protein [Syntrophobacteraceae bacterium]
MLIAPLLPGILAGSFAPISYAGARGGEDFLTAEERSWLAEHPHITLAPERSYPPFVFLDADDQVKGISLDYVRLLESKLGVRLQLTESMRLPAILDRARRGEVDVVTSLMQTPKRGEFLLFTKPYITVPAVVVVRNGYEGPSALGEMGGSRIAVGSGYAVQSYLETSCQSIRLVPVDDDGAGLRMASFGEVDAVVADLASASYLIERLKITNLRVAGDVGFNYELSLGSRKDWPILNRILDKGIAEINRSEQRAIYDRWVTLDHSRFPTRAFGIGLALLLGVMAFITACVTLWNRSLQIKVSQRTRALDEELAERRKIQESLHSKEATLLGILEATKESIWQFSPEGVVLMANETALERYGKPSGEVIGKSVEDLFSAELAQSRLAHLKDAVETGRPVEFRDQRGGLLFLHSYYPVLDGDGQVSSVAAFGRDITERKRAEDALRDSLAEKTALLKEVHHRVKNNLQIVASLLNLQIHRSASQSVVSILLDTRNRVKSMALLHEKLYGSGNLAHVNVASYMRDLCHQLLFSFGHTANRVAVEQRVASVGLPLEQAVPCGLIVNELVSNALKHAFPGDRAGRVVVGLDVAEDRRLVLTVQDDGIGLPPDFDPETTSTLGLQIVSRLATQLEGQFEVGLPDGAGTLFRVPFPRPENSGLGEES